MDLSAVMTKIDLHKYVTVKDFLHDVDLIWKNALEYNPDKDPSGKVLGLLVVLYIDNVLFILTIIVIPLTYFFLKTIFFLY